MKLSRSKLPSPLGELVLVVDDQKSIRALTFADRMGRLRRTLNERHSGYDLVSGPPPSPIRNALERYFAGELAALDNLMVAVEGTELERSVWAALRHIPAGTTTTYGELARTLGFDDPRAAIDIGVVNGANPIAIVVPCHRVIGINGDFKGYAWGPHRKRWLLEHESAIRPRSLQGQSLTLPGF